MVVLSMYHIIFFIKTENIAVNEIGRIICSHPLAHAQTSLCMHDTVTCNFVAYYNAVQ